MAKASVVNKKYSLTLTLDQDEVDFLVAALARVGGSPTNSPRKHRDAITDAIRDATRLSWHEAKTYPLSTGGIQFSNYQGEQCQ